ncbi:RAxF-45 family protein [Bacillus sp. DJP31]
MFNKVAVRTQLFKLNDSCRAITFAIFIKGGSLSFFNNRIVATNIS